MCMEFGCVNVKFYNESGWKIMCKIWFLLIFLKWLWYFLFKEDLILNIKILFGYNLFGIEFLVWFGKNFILFLNSLLFLMCKFFGKENYLEWLIGWFICMS